MLTSRWLPVAANELNQFQREFNRLFSFPASRVQWPGLASSYPLVNLWEDDQNLYAEAELPGLALENLEIYVSEGNQLALQGERQPTEGPKGTWHRRERGFGKFSRSFTLPVEVDADRVEARLEQGVLRLTLPKSERAKPRRITVKAE